MSDGGQRPARVVLFANNAVGRMAAEAIAEAGDSIVALVLNEPRRRRLGDQIVDAAKKAGLPDDSIFEATELDEPETIEAIHALGADVGVSALFGRILRREIFGHFPLGCVNVHPAFLPYNRGAYPNVWSIVEGTPAGVTIHYVDEGVDTGDIIAQREVEVKPVDTGSSLYARLERECGKLFRETWPAIRAGNAPRTPQPKDGGTTHRIRDVKSIDAIDLDGTYTARELLDILRARSFPPYYGAYITDGVGGHRIYLELKLRYDD
jgi:methionyl-tRNA formyltransferase